MVALQQTRYIRYHMEPVDLKYSVRRPVRHLVAETVGTAALFAHYRVEAEPVGQAVLLLGDAVGAQHTFWILGNMLSFEWTSVWTIQSEPFVQQQFKRPMIVSWEESGGAEPEFELGVPSS